MGIFERARNALVDRALATNTGRKAAMRTAAAMGNGVVYRNFGDHKLVVDSSELIGRTILKHGSFSRDILDTAVEFLANAGALPKDAVFVDVGANIGTHTVYANLTGHFSEFICVEPDPANFELLAANIALNGMTPRVSLVNSGAGEKDGELNLYRVDQNGGASSFVAHPNGRGKSATVTIKRLDDVLGGLGIAGDRIGLLWIDTEGFEPSVWRGMPALLETMPNVVLEFSPQIYGAAATRDFCAELFRRYDRIRMFDGARLVDCTCDGLAAVTGQADLLLTEGRGEAETV